MKTIAMAPIKTLHARCLTAASHVIKLCLGAAALVLLAEAAFGQAPGLVWSTPIGGSVFAVDSQTNVYVSDGTKVVLLSAAGLPFQTNSFCPRGGIAQRDASGNFYFGGSFDGTQDFGGITLVGGWLYDPLKPPGQWTPGNPTCYLAKYSSVGALQWAVSFGYQGSPNTLTDLLLDGKGGCFAGYWTTTKQGWVAHINATGGFDWSTVVAGSSAVSYLPVKLGGLTSSNCSYLGFRSMDPLNYLAAGRVDFSGNYANLGAFPLKWPVSASTNAKPVIDSTASVFELGQCFSLSDPGCASQELRKCGPGSTELWSEYVTSDAQWTLAGDAQDHVYVSGSNGMLAQYDTNGSLVWSNNFAQPCVAMVVDAAGNRFVSFQDGSVGRLQSGQSPHASLGFAASSGGGVQLTLTSATPSTWQILGSSNLLYWETVGWVTNSSGQAQFTDPATQRPMRFYKALLLH